MFKCNNCGLEIKNDTTICPRCKNEIKKEKANYFTIGIGSALAASASVAAIKNAYKKDPSNSIGLIAKIKNALSKKKGTNETTKITNVTDNNSKIENINEESSNQDVISTNEPINENKIDNQNNDSVVINNKTSKINNDSLIINNTTKSKTKDKAKTSASVNEIISKIIEKKTENNENNKEETSTTNEEKISITKEKESTTNEEEISTIKEETEETSTLSDEKIEKEIQSLTEEELEEIISSLSDEELEKILLSLSDEELEEIMSGLLDTNITTDDESNSNELQCICTEKCNESSINTLCPVCKLNHELCEAVEATASSGGNDNISTSEAAFINLCHLFGIASSGNYANVSLKNITDSDGKKYIKDDENKTSPLDNIKNDYISPIKSSAPICDLTQIEKIFENISTSFSEYSGYLNNTIEAYEKSGTAFEDLETRGMNEAIENFTSLFISTNSFQQFSDSNGTYIINEGQKIYIDANNKVYTVDENNNKVYSKNDDDSNKTLADIYYEFGYKFTPLLEECANYAVEENEDGTYSVNGKTLTKEQICDYRTTSSISLNLLVSAGMLNLDENIKDNYTVDNYTLDTIDMYWYDNNGNVSLTRTEEQETLDILYLQNQLNRDDIDWDDNKFKKNIDDLQEIEVDSITDPTQKEYVKNIDYMLATAKPDIYNFNDENASSYAKYLDDEIISAFVSNSYIILHHDELFASDEEYNEWLETIDKSFYEAALNPTDDFKNKIDEFTENGIDYEYAFNNLNIDGLYESTYGEFTEADRQRLIDNGTLTSDTFVEYQNRYWETYVEPELKAAYEANNDVLSDTITADELYEYALNNSLLKDTRDEYVFNSHYLNQIAEPQYIANYMQLKNSVTIADNAITSGETLKNFYVDPEYETIYENTCDSYDNYNKALIRNYAYTYLISQYSGNSTNMEDYALYDCYNKIISANAYNINSTYSSINNQSAKDFYTAYHYLNVNAYIDEETIAKIEEYNNNEENYNKITLDESVYALKDIVKSLELGYDYQKEEIQKQYLQCVLPIYTNKVVNNLSLNVDQEKLIATIYKNCKDLNYNSLTTSERMVIDSQNYIDSINNLSELKEELKNICKEFCDDDCNVIYEENGERKKIPLYKVILEWTELYYSNSTEEERQAFFKKYNLNEDDFDGAISTAISALNQIHPFLKKNLTNEEKSELIDEYGTTLLDTLDATLNIKEFDYNSFGYFIDDCSIYNNSDIYKQCNNNYYSAFNIKYGFQDEIYSDLANDSYKKLKGYTFDMIELFTEKNVTNDDGSINESANEEARILYKLAHEIYIKFSDSPDAQFDEYGNSKIIELINNFDFEGHDNLKKNLLNKYMTVSEAELIVSQYQSITSYKNELNNLTNYKSKIYEANSAINALNRKFKLEETEEIANKKEEYNNYSYEKSYYEATEDSGAGFEEIPAKILDSNGNEIDYDDPEAQTILSYMYINGQIDKKDAVSLFSKTFGDRASELIEYYDSIINEANDVSEYNTFSNKENLVNTMLYNLTTFGETSYCYNNVFSEINEQSSTYVGNKENKERLSNITKNDKIIIGDITYSVDSNGYLTNDTGVTSRDNSYAKANVNIIETDENGNTKYDEDGNVIYKLKTIDVNVLDIYFVEDETTGLKYACVKDDEGNDQRVYVVQNGNNINIVKNANNKVTNGYAEYHQGTWSDYWKNKGYAISDGWYQFTSGYSNATNADGLLNSHDVLVSSYASYLKQNYGGYMNASYNIATSVTNMAPSIVAGLAIGTVCKSAGISTIATAILNVASTVATMGVTSYGNYKEENLQSGMTVRGSTVSASISALGEVGLESVLGNIPGISLVSKGAEDAVYSGLVSSVQNLYKGIFAKGGKAALKAAGTDALSFLSSAALTFCKEGIEEAAQDYLNDIAQRSNGGEGVEDLFKTSLQSFWYGGVTGLLLNGGGIISQNVSQAITGDGMAINNALNYVTEFAVSNNNVLDLTELAFNRTAREQFNTLMNEFKNGNYKTLIESYQSNPTLIENYNRFVEESESNNKSSNKVVNGITKLITGNETNSFEDYCSQQLMKNVLLKSELTSELERFSNQINILESGSEENISRIESERLSLIANRILEDIGFDDESVITEINEKLKNSTSLVEVIEAIFFSDKSNHVLRQGMNTTEALQSIIERRSKNGRISHNRTINSFIELIENNYESAIQEIENNLLDQNGLTSARNSILATRILDEITFDDESIKTEITERIKNCDNVEEVIKVIFFSDKSNHVLRKGMHATEALQSIIESRSKDGRISTNQTLNSFIELVENHFEEAINEYNNITFTELIEKYFNTSFTFNSEYSNLEALRNTRDILSKFEDMNYVDLVDKFINFETITDEQIQMFINTISDSLMNTNAIFEGLINRIDSNNTELFNLFYSKISKENKSQYVKELIKTIKNIDNEEIRTTYNEDIVNYINISETTINNLINEIDNLKDERNDSLINSLMNELNLTESEKAEIKELLKYSSNIDEIIESIFIENNSKVRNSLIEIINKNEMLSIEERNAITQLLQSEITESNKSQIIEAIRNYYQNTIDEINNVYNENIKSLINNSALGLYLEDYFIELSNEEIDLNKVLEETNELISRKENYINKLKSNKSTLDILEENTSEYEDLVAENNSIINQIEIIERKLNSKIETLKEENIKLYSKMLITSVTETIPGQNETVLYNSKNKLNAIDTVLERTESSEETRIGILLGITSITGNILTNNNSSLVSDIINLYRGRINELKKQNKIHKKNSDIVSRNNREIQKLQNSEREILGIMSEYDIKENSPLKDLNTKLEEKTKSLKDSISTRTTDINEQITSLETRIDNRIKELQELKFNNNYEEVLNKIKSQIENIKLETNLDNRETLLSNYEVMFESIEKSINEQIGNHDSKVNELIEQNKETIPSLRQALERESNNFYRINERYNGLYLNYRNTESKLKPKAKQLKQEELSRLNELKKKSIAKMELLQERINNPSNIDEQNIGNFDIEIRTKDISDLDLKNTIETKKTLLESIKNLTSRIDNTINNSSIVNRVKKLSIKDELKSIHDRLRIKGILSEEEIARIRERYEILDAEYEVIIEETQRMNNEEFHQRVNEYGNKGTAIMSEICDVLGIERGFIKDISQYELTSEQSQAIEDIFNKYQKQEVIEHVVETQRMNNEEFHQRVNEYGNKGTAIMSEICDVLGIERGFIKDISQYELTSEQSQAIEDIFNKYQKQEVIEPITETYDLEGKTIEELRKLYDEIGDRADSLSDMYFKLKEKHDAIDENTNLEEKTKLHNQMLEYLGQHDQLESVRVSILDKINETKNDSKVETHISEEIGEVKLNAPGNIYDSEIIDIKVPGSIDDSNITNKLDETTTIDNTNTLLQELDGKLEELEKEESKIQSVIDSLSTIEDKLAYLEKIKNNKPSSQLVEKLLESIINERIDEDANLDLLEQYKNLIDYETRSDLIGIIVLNHIDSLNTIEEKLAFYNEYKSDIVFLNSVRDTIIYDLFSNITNKEEKFEFAKYNVEDALTGNVRNELFKYLITESTASIEQKIDVFNKTYLITKGNEYFEIVKYLISETTNINEKIRLYNNKFINYYYGLENQYIAIDILNDIISNLSSAEEKVEFINFENKVLSELYKYENCTVLGSDITAIIHNDTTYYIEGRSEDVLSKFHSQEEFEEFCNKYLTDNQFTLKITENNGQLTVANGFNIQAFIKYKNIESDIFMHTTSYEGNYGVNQNPKVNMFTLGKHLKDVEIIDFLMNKYNMSDINVCTILQNVLDSTGACTYANLCNIIFSSFKGDSTAFKNCFGFDMYYYNKDTGKQELNGKLLLADMYLFMNSEENGGKIFGLVDGELQIIGKSVDQVYMDNLEDAKKYLVSKNININIEGINTRGYYNADGTLNTKKLSTYLRSVLTSGKKLSISENVKLYQGSYFNENLGFYTDESCSLRYMETYSWIDKNKSTETYESAGHITFITEVTDNGVYIVSWGKKLFLKYEELNLDYYNGNSSIFVTDISYESSGVKTETDIQIQERMIEDIKNQTGIDENTLNEFIDQENNRTTNNTPSEIIEIMSEYDINENSPLNKLRESLIQNKQTEFTSNQESIGNEESQVVNSAFIENLLTSNDVEQLRNTFKSLTIDEQFEIIKELNLNDRIKLLNNLEESVVTNLYAKIKEVSGNNEAFYNKNKDGKVTDFFEGDIYSQRQIVSIFDITNVELSLKAVTEMKSGISEEIVLDAMAKINDINSPINSFEEYYKSKAIELVQKLNGLELSDIFYKQIVINSQGVSKTNKFIENISKLNFEEIKMLNDILDTSSYSDILNVKKDENTLNNIALSIFTKILEFNKNSDIKFKTTYENVKGQLLLLNALTNSSKDIRVQQEMLSTLLSGYFYTSGNFITSEEELLNQTTSLLQSAFNDSSLSINGNKITINGIEYDIILKNVDEEGKITYSINKEMITSKLKNFSSYETRLLYNFLESTAQSVLDTETKELDLKEKAETEKLDLKEKAEAEKLALKKKAEIYYNMRNSIRDAAQNLQCGINILPKTGTVSLNSSFDGIVVNNTMKLNIPLCKFICKKFSISIGLTEDGVSQTAYEAIIQFLKSNPDWVDAVIESVYEEDYGTKNDSNQVSILIKGYEKTIESAFTSNIYVNRAFGIGLSEIIKTANKMIKDGADISYDSAFEIAREIFEFNNSLFDNILFDKNGIKNYNLIDESNYYLYGPFASYRINKENKKVKISYSIRWPSFGGFIPNTVKSINSSMNEEYFISRIGDKGGTSFEILYDGGEKASISERSVPIKDGKIFEGKINMDKYIELCDLLRNDYDIIKNMKDNKIEINKFYSSRSEYYKSNGWEYLGDIEIYKEIIEKFANQRYDGKTLKDFRERGYELDYGVYGKIAEYGNLSGNGNQTTLLLSWDYLEYLGIITNVSEGKIYYE